MTRKTKILVAIFKHHSTNKIGDRQEYPQTWWIVAKMPSFIQTTIQKLCGMIGGHELSATEWGYGGGENADCWCRWCNKYLQVPKTVVYFKNKGSKESYESSNT